MTKLKSFGQVKYELTEHDYDYDTYYPNPQYDKASVYLSILPSTDEVIEAIGKKDYFFSLVDRTKLKAVLPEGKLPGVIYLVWVSGKRNAYTLTPVSEV
jgi:hypothetical protein